MARIKVRRFTQEDLWINPHQIVSMEIYRGSMFNPLDRKGCIISLSNGEKIHTIESYEEVLKLYDAAMRR